MLTKMQIYKKTLPYKDWDKAPFHYSSIEFDRCKFKNELNLPLLKIFAFHGCTFKADSVVHFETSSTMNIWFKHCEFDKDSSITINCDLVKFELCDIPQECKFQGHVKHLIVYGESAAAYFGGLTCEHLWIRDDHPRKAEICPFPRHYFSAARLGVHYANGSSKLLEHLSSVAYMHPKFMVTAQDSLEPLMEYPLRKVDACFVAMLSAIYFPRLGTRFVLKDMPIDLFRQCYTFFK